MSKKIGIYKIEDTETGKIYIGSSHTDLARRLSCHNSKIKNGYHEYDEFNIAYADNPDRIKYEILEYCTKDDDISKLEKDYIRYFKRIEGFEVINKTERTHKKGKVKNTINMCKAQQSMNNPRCRLTKHDIYNVLEMVDFGMSKQEIAELYDISVSYISRIGKDRRVQEYKEYIERKEKEVTSNV
ncbi:GIY-YIG nuclease family protein [Wukongibacter sp. M2B1]|uniref:GIY-YIG nuclease family protein n=1 Tax=Wukongibacter sp. M2B1 TaxID=3088895 RepID=UPI003D7BCE06